MWNKLTATVIALYQQGRYSEAAQVAEEALRFVEKTFGSNHPDVATVLENMAEFYKKIGKQDEARKLEERAKKSAQISKG